jgi:anti-sigma-K factor RskA
MDVEKYISSGILELYVAGALSEEQNIEVHRYAQEYPEVKEEIIAIEKSILDLSSTAAIKTGKRKGFSDIVKRIDVDDPTPVVHIKSSRSNWAAWTGWVAAILLGAGLWWFYLQNKNMRSDMQLRSSEVQVLQEQIFQARNSRDTALEFLNAIRDKDVEVVTLEGQSKAPDSYARAYWNKADESVIIDAKGLPDPPPGMVYQVWSLKMSPLTSTSIGLLENFATDENKIYTLANPNDSEGFGISLEPEGGSETMTMEQLYTQGEISS